MRQLGFLTAGTGRTLSQAAIQCILAEPAVASVLPNIYNETLLKEFAAAPGTPPITADELAKVAELYAGQFGLASAGTIS